MIKLLLITSLFINTSDSTASYRDTITLENKALVAQLKVLWIKYPLPNVKTPVIIYKAKEENENRIEQAPISVRRGTALDKGRIIVFSDAHFYPDDTTTAYKALLKFIEHFKPNIIVNNGDSFDGGSISRFPRIGWEVTDQFDAANLTVFVAFDADMDGHHINDVRNGRQVDELVGAVVVVVERFDLEQAVHRG